MDKKYGKIAELVHFLIKGSYEGKENLNFLDLTCGNGNDTLFLSSLAGPKGHVTGLDIQEEAVERTKNLLKEKSKYNNYTIIRDSHEFAEKYIRNKIDAAVYNLGYLPNSDKNIVTQAQTTIRSINSLLPYLKDSGRIYITAYITHDKGYEIYKISDFLNCLDKRLFNVIHINLVNKDNNPPELYIIEQNL
ncbi:MAG TPA: class I SAM-dependent methyltransferase [Sedimentibacter sp.]|jgi:SAM-dependent methyltransferase|nr:class I SAM-dependent methyltransferase [Sedimentibacter sp.]HHY99637.1 methyltransferase domain-containing protein [Tissierellia bacterium]HOW22057.1 class I SAM-dependent methyltransferase [Sedimentibacter sp.]